MKLSPVLHIYSSQTTNVCKICKKQSNTLRYQPYHYDFNLCPSALCQHKSEDPIQLGTPGLAKQTHNNFMPLLVRLIKSRQGLHRKGMLITV